MENRVITIARSYGSGGRKMGRLLAKELGYEYYDREILRIASDESGISEELFRQADEKQHIPLFRIAREVYTGEVIPPDSDDFISNENLFRYQAKIIRDLAKEESCVIIGRCADYILRNRPHCMRIFLHAPAEYRVKRIMRTENLSHDAALTKAIQMNRKRSDNYHYYTHQPWGLSRNYHLTLDTSLGDDFVLDSICEGLKHIQ